MDLQVSVDSGNGCKIDKLDPQVIDLGTLGKNLIIVHGNNTERMNGCDG